MSKQETWRPAPVVFFSGGMDSYIHLYWAVHEFLSSFPPSALYVDFGHRYSALEKKAALELCQQQGVPITFRSFDVSDQEGDDAFIPLRNLFLLQIGTYYSDDLVFGMLYHEGPPDKRPGFVRRMSSLLSEQYCGGQYFWKGRKIRIHCPFQRSTKTEMLHWYLSRGGAVAPILRTVGCYDALGHCGRCISCFNRWIALVNNGLTESYRRHPLLWAAGQWLTGRKKSTRLLSPFTLLYKWKYVKEIYMAVKTIHPSPLSLAVRVWRSKNLRELEERLRRF